MPGGAPRLGLLPIAGEALLTITGRGFPDYSLLLLRHTLSNAINQTSFPLTILLPLPPTGGTLLTITGRGFPDTSAPLLNNIVNITIKGQPCTVVSSNYTTVLCSTPAQGTLVQPTVTLANGTVVYPVSNRCWFAAELV